jgi:hypothetical protein
MKGKGGGSVAAKNAKEYLNQYRQSMERSAEIEQHLVELKAEAIRLKDHEGRSIALDHAVQKYVDACDQSGAELSRLAALRAEIVGAIEGVESKTLRKILYRKYVLGETLEKIAADMHYHYVSICRLHGAALHAVTANIPA